MKQFLIFITLILSVTLKAQTCAVNAGTDQTICVSSPLNLTGFVGTPQSMPPVVTWTQISGPAGATITSPNTANTSVMGFAPGNYVFQLSNKCSDNINAIDLIVVTVLPEPPTALAGPDITQCSNTPTQLAANAVVAPNTGTWSVSPSGGTFLPNVNAPNATYTPPGGAGVYTLTWTISNGSCTKTDDIIVRVTAPTLPVNAGPDITLVCSGSCATLAGSNPGLAPQGGFWSIVSGPSSPVITNPTLNTSTVCGLKPGSYTLRWTVNGFCGGGSDDMVINVTNINEAPISSGSYQTLVCTTPRPNTVILTGTALTAGETGIWVLSSGQTGVTLSPNATTATVTATGVANGPYEYIFTWTKTNAAGCTAIGYHYITATASIVNLTTPANQTLACDATNGSFNISYNYQTSGYLNNSPTLISFPAGGGGATISSPNEAYGATAVTQTFNIGGMNIPGVYVYKVLYDNNCANAVRTVAVTVSRTPGLVNAGSDIVLPCNNLSANPIGSSSSSGAGYSLNWTQVSGPNTATLSNKTTTSLGMAGLLQGVYTIRLNVSGGGTCPAKTDDMIVVVTSAAPTVATVGANATICYGNYQLGANVVNAPLETGTWTSVPSAGISFLPNANAPNAKISGMLPNTGYTLTWTVSNACGTKTATQVLNTNNTQSPPIPNAQPDQCITGTGTLTTTLPGSAPNGATITWVALDAGSSLSPTNTQNTTATITGANGSYRFVYRLATTGCTTLADTVVITKTSNIVANAGADINICANTLPASTTLAATAATNGNWAQVSGPTTATITNPILASSTLTNLAAGVYEFEWRIKGGVCADAVDIMVVSVAQTPTVANAGSDQSICGGNYGTVITLAGNNPTVGTGYWSLVSSPTGSYGITITNPAQFNTTVTPGWTNGVFKFVWTTTNTVGCAISTDTMLVNFGVFAYAGNNANLCNATNALLFGDINTTGTWSQVSGPATTITTNTSNSANVSGLTTGTTTPNVYTYKYTIPAVGACPSTSSNVVYTNYPKPSQAVAGADVQLCYNQNTVSLTGNNPAVGIGTWVYESGPNTPTAGTANNAFVDTTLNNIIPGIYVYKYEVNTTGGCVASVSKMQIIKETTANANADIRVCNVNTINLNATPAIANTGTWTLISGSAGASITNVNAPNTAVTGMVAGTYVFRWTIAAPAGLGCATNSDDVQVIIDQAVTGINAGIDTSFCEGSVNPFTIGSPTQAGVTYSWVPASLLSNAAIAQPLFTGVNNSGNYTYTIKGSNGVCETFSQVKLNVKPKSITAFTVDGTGCFTVFTVAQTNAGSTYNWTFGTAASPATQNTVGPHTVSYSTAGTKTAKLVVTNANGCKDSSTITFTPTCLLPLTLTQFNVAWKNNIPFLTWHVENAVNFSNFIVQRSIDGVNFTDISSINFVNSQPNYNFLDIALQNPAGKIFYRLVMVDIGGRNTTSTIKSLVAVQKSNVVIYPNPFVNSVEIVFNVVKNNENILVELYTAEGRLILTKANTYNSGNNTITLTAMNKFASGLYILKIKREGGVTTQKLIKSL